jgi:hypothetical protein
MYLFTCSQPSTNGRHISPPMLLLLIKPAGVVVLQIHAHRAVQINVLVLTSCAHMQGMTAHYLTSDAHANLIKAGDWCLIHGVGGGTCQWAAQVCIANRYVSLSLSLSLSLFLSLPICTRSLCLHVHCSPCIYVHWCLIHCVNGGTC